VNDATALVIYRFAVAAVVTQRLLAEPLLAERRTILQLRNEQIINDEVPHRIQRDPDLAELRLKRS
jgi:hypothetical protein